MIHYMKYVEGSLRTDNDQENLNKVGLESNETVFFYTSGRKPRLKNQSMLTLNICKSFQFIFASKNLH